MSESTTTGARIVAMAESAGRAMSLSDAYRRFGDTDVKGASPLYERVSIAIADSPAALAVVELAPLHKRHPTLIIAALHDQVLRGHAPALADAYAARDAERAGDAAVEALIALADSVLATAAQRQTQTNETGRGAVLYPAIAEAAHRFGADRVALIDVGCSAGLNLNVDQFGIRYEPSALYLGDRASVVQLQCQLKGSNAVPVHAIPEVVARIGVDLDPIDVENAADARWLRACLWPDQPERIDRLNAAMQLASKTPATLLEGDALDRLPDAFDMVPAGVLAVVTTTWALAYFSLEDRLRFLRRLDVHGAHHPTAWVSAEGVGIAPGIPTLGDSRLSAHSVVGLALLDGATMRAEAIGRCHPHGQWLEWTS